MIFFRNKFQQLREARGLTQKQIAAACGVAESSVCGWETGINIPRAARIPKLAAILQCQESDLAQYGPVEKALDAVNEEAEQLQNLLFGADVAEEVRQIRGAVYRRDDLSPSDPDCETAIAEENAEIRENLHSMFQKLSRHLKIADLPEGALDDFKFGLLRALIKSDMAPEDKDKALKIVENFGAER